MVSQHFVYISQKFKYTLHDKNVTKFIISPVQNENIWIFLLQFFFVFF